MDLDRRKMWYMIGGTAALFIVALGATVAADPSIINGPTSTNTFASTTTSTVFTNGNATVTQQNTQLNEHQIWTVTETVTTGTITETVTNTTTINTTVNCPGTAPYC